MGACRSCGAAIVWAKKADGSPTPLEACEPAEGNIHVDANGIALVGKKGSGHYLSHFARCPQAASWRKKKG